MPDLDDDLLPWFEKNHLTATLTSRLAANVAAQLYGALTTGQAASQDIGIGACLKYELEEGLLEQLARFARDSLTADQVGHSDDLEGLADALDAATEFIHEHRRELVKSKYSDQPIVSEAMRRLQRVAANIDSIIDRCTARLIDRGRT